MSKKIQGVHIFSAGTWNDDPYTEDDLEGMVTAFNETKESIRPALKLGHDNDQKILQNSGLPAAGWVDRIYRIGSRLYADFTDIPTKVYEALEKKAYRRVSSEVYIGVKILDKSYQYVIGAVALLGPEVPGVMNLSDILAQYGLKDYHSMKAYSEGDETKVRVYNFETQKQENDPMPKSEAELKLEAQIEVLKEQNTTLGTDNKKFESDNKTLKDEKDASDKKAFEAEKAAKTATVNASVDSLVAEGLCTKGMKPFVAALIGPEKKTYSFGEGDDKKEITSKSDLLKETLKLFKKAAKVNLVEGSVGGTKAGEGVKTEDDINEAIEKYMADHKCDYGTAYSAVAGRKEFAAAQEVDSISPEEDDD